MQPANSTIEFSLGKFNDIFSFKRMFEALKTSFEKERKDVMFQRKTRNEQSQYFNFMKFFFSSPDAI